MTKINTRPHNLLKTLGSETHNKISNTFNMITLVHTLTHTHTHKRTIDKYMYLEENGRTENHKTIINSLCWSLESYNHNDNDVNVTMETQKGAWRAAIH